ncbi:lytic transglycosylase domain-containing protein [Acetobacter sp. TBRC 12305]|uniref:Lytic transglycosylase domain-containing protein n=1 Tax=Acetobacter garciniae TaxID=2817435 RepID=A0A939KN05_9PROT|nr:lytic transglycosylase domain-containing protein [Acetobacter garciniae]MBO1325120.1 lytic transglycosylase domain-containing protein [Acetobacter garciniae]MBX0344909.1 lytic transglycosylase domain-containing protein [Acetobacter garciniae]
MAIVYLGCMVLAASLYHLPPRVLPVIQLVEGGRNGLIHRNTNGTEDLGVMQVNTIWVGPIARYTHTAPQTVYRNLLSQPCYNISAAGAIMRLNLLGAGGNLMRAVGDYHSHTTLFNQSYQALVLARARALFAQPPARATPQVLAPALPPVVAPPLVPTLDTSGGITGSAP